MVYLFIYSNSFGIREDISQFLSSNTIIEHWRFDMPNCYYLASNSSAQVIAQSIQDQFPNRRFLISRITEYEYQGWLPRATWNFIRDNL